MDGIVSFGRSIVWAFVTFEPVKASYTFVGCIIGQVYWLMPACILVLLACMLFSVEWRTGDRERVRGKCEG